MSMVKENCDICHLPFSPAGRNSVTKLGIGDCLYLMCNDCRRSLELWRRTQEEAGLETLEKNF